MASYRQAQRQADIARRAAPTFEPRLASATAGLLVMSQAGAAAATASTKVMFIAIVAAESWSLIAKSAATTYEPMLASTGSHGERSVRVTATR